VVSLLGQFAVHYYALTQVLDLAHAAQGLENRASLDAQFTPNMVNTAVFLITSAMQVATFTINHRVRPPPPPPPPPPSICVMCAMRRRSWADVCIVCRVQGRPFKEDLWENKGLLYGLSAMATLTLVAALESIPPFNTYLQLVPLPVRLPLPHSLSPLQPTSRICSFASPSSPRGGDNNSSSGRWWGTWLGTSSSHSCGTEFACSCSGEHEESTMTTHECGEYFCTFLSLFIGKLWFAPNSPPRLRQARE
jgi:hypothetical protein